MAEITIPIWKQVGIFNAIKIVLPKLIIQLSIVQLPSMVKSEKIKLEIERLADEASQIQGTIQEKQKLSALRYKQATADISDFTENTQLEIDRVKLESDRAAKATFAKVHSDLQADIQAKSGLTYASWESSLWDSFDIEKERLGHNLTRLGSYLVKGQNGQLQFPAMFPILEGKNILLRAKGSGRSKARGVLRNTALRLLASLPPGRLRFTFIDPVDLGSTAAGLVGSLPNVLTGGIAWHEEQDIQDQLSLVETHIAAIKTKRLGIEFPTIEAYNAKEGTIKEPYWLIVVSDCPIRFRESALQKLVSIAKNGPPAGVYLAVMLDEGEKKCADSLISDIAQTANQIVCPDGGNVFFDDPDFKNLVLELDSPPPSALVKLVTEQVAKTAADSNIVRVTWEAPPLEKWWESDSRSGLKIPIGVHGAREMQFFEFDEKLLNSALIIGKPGSGKSRLLHVLINGMTTRYSPQDLALYLLDCKQVEFKDYAAHKLPHARVVAIESEREFGLSVLRSLSAELDFRKTEFSTAGETSLSSYRNKTGKPMPRVVLIIDEFQELLNSGDALATEAASILDRLIRLGRALGMNVILASQSLAGGSTTLQTSTRNQIPIRVVLQCSEMDSEIALGQGNNEARLLERPGEAIFNAANGRRDGNNRFQVTWLSDEALEILLGKMSSLAAQKDFTPTAQQVIFDGNSSADIRKNGQISGILRKEIMPNLKKGIPAYLGDPIEMKPPTAAMFRKQSRSSLLILGQNEYEQSCVSMLMAAAASLAIQQPPEAARFIILNLADSSAEWSQLPEAFKNAFPNQVDVITKASLNGKLGEMIALIERKSAETTPTNDASIYLVVIGLHRDRSLRKADTGFKLTKSDAPKVLSATEMISKICQEGPAFGIHLLLWCDTYSNFDRVFQRNDVNEFSLRVALQMSEADSRSLFDSDDATKLGSQRALFVDDEGSGRLEKFRPYSQINVDWFNEISGQLMK